MVWRVLTHERGRATLAEVEDRWCLMDLLDAHLALSVHDDLAEAQADRARAESASAAAPRRRR